VRRVHISRTCSGVSAVPITICVSLLHSYVITIHCGFIAVITMKSLRCYTNPLFILAVWSPGLVGASLVFSHYGLRGLGTFCGA
jgi:hypothetical protein